MKDPKLMQEIETIAEENKEYFDTIEEEEGL